MNDKPKPLLVVSYSKILNQKHRKLMSEGLEKLANPLGYAAILLDGGLTAEVHNDNDELVSAIKDQTKVIADQSALLSAAVMQMAKILEVLADHEDGDDGDDDDDGYPDSLDQPAK